MKNLVFVAKMLYVRKLQLVAAREGSLVPSLLSGSLKATLVSNDVSFLVAVKDASEAEPSFIGKKTALHLATENCLMFRNIVKNASENKWILASTFSVMNVLNQNTRHRSDK
ncbi:hypothetical protein CEXT_140231 [Caerostris extrusa]|uniref:Uncharacterized protein n=1 Tax=Caerostris extrusa TaxID=172846 RepID=A0AAV4XLX1_CAEEX|nr:hypothetical protein CEXT_140231 [Caerostris extrusa]